MKYNEENIQIFLDQIDYAFPERAPLFLSMFSESYQDLIKGIRTI